MQVIVKVNRIVLKINKINFKNQASIWVILVQFKINKKILITTPSRQIIFLINPLSQKIAYNKVKRVPSKVVLISLTPIIIKNKKSHQKIFLKKVNHL